MTDETLDDCPDPFHWHEALDRTSVVISLLESALRDHPVITQSTELSELFETSVESLNNLYQKIGEIDPYWSDETEESLPTEEDG